MEQSRPMPTVRYMPDTATSCGSTLALELCEATSFWPSKQRYAKPTWTGLNRARRKFGHYRLPRLRRIGQDPTVQGGVVDRQAALQKQLLDITVAERLAQIPSDSLQGQRRLKVPALKIAQRGVAGAACCS